MRPEFLSAVVDTLLPGDDAGTGASGVGAPASERSGEASPPLPTGTVAGVAAKLAAHLAGRRDDDPYVAVLQAVANAAGGEDAFTRADPARRAAVLQRVENEMRGPFRLLVARVLRDYYEAEPVIRATGWRVEPPQPQGHALPPFDEALLEPVKRRGRMWR